MLRTAVDRRGLHPVLWVALGVLLGLGIDARFRGGRTPPAAKALTNSIPSLQGPAPTPSRFSSRAHSVSRFAELTHLLQSSSAVDLEQALSAIRTLDQAECAKALALVAHLPEVERRVLMQAIARRWASLGAWGVLAQARAQASSETQQYLLKAAGEEIARSDPANAFAHIQQIGSRMDRLFASHFILSEIAKVDPGRVAQFLAGSREFLVDSDLYREVASSFAQQSPDAALKWAQSLPDGQAKFNALRYVWGKWAEMDPAGVAASLGEQTPNPAFERDIYSNIARSWSRTDPSAALAWIESLPRQQQETAWASFSVDASQLGTENTLKLLQSIDSEQRRAEIASRVVAQIARDDPAAGIAFAEKLPEGAARVRALGPAVREWAGREPAKAVDYVAALPPGSGRADLLRGVIAHWAGADPYAAFQWLRDFPPGDERDDAVQQALGELKEFSGGVGRDGLDWADLVTNPQKREEAIDGIASAWAETDAGAAAEWLRRQPDADRLSGAHERIAKEWTFVDAGAAASWIENLPLGAARDAAIDGFVGAMDGYDPGLATRWAATIQEPKQRERTVTSVFLRWVDRDAAEAANWAQGVQLSEDLRAKLLAAAATKRAAATAH